MKATDPDRYEVEPSGDSFVVRDKRTNLLVIDGIIPLMRATREAADEEVRYLLRLRRDEAGRRP